MAAASPPLPRPWTEPPRVVSRYDSYEQIERSAKILRQDEFLKIGFDQLNPGGFDGYDADFVRRAILACGPEREILRQSHTYFIDCESETEVILTHSLQNRPNRAHWLVGVAQCPPMVFPAAYAAAKRAYEAAAHAYKAAIAENAAARTDKAANEAAAARKDEDRLAKASDTSFDLNASGQDRLAKATVNRFDLNASGQDRFAKATVNRFDLNASGQESPAESTKRKPGTASDEPAAARADEDVYEDADEAARALFITDELDELTDEDKAWADANLELFRNDRTAWVQGSRDYVKSTGDNENDAFYGTSSAATSSSTIHHSFGLSLGGLQSHPLPHGISNDPLASRTHWTLAWTPKSSKAIPRSAMPDATLDRLRSRSAMTKTKPSTLRPLLLLPRPCLKLPVSLSQVMSQRPQPSSIINRRGQQANERRKSVRFAVENEDGLEKVEVNGKSKNERHKASQWKRKGEQKADEENAVENEDGLEKVEVSEKSKNAHHKASQRKRKGEQKADEENAVEGDNEE